MKYNIGDTVYTISIAGYMKEYIIIGKIYCNFFGITYKTKYACMGTEYGDKIAFNKREIHRIEK